MVAAAAAAAAVCCACPPAAAVAAASAALSAVVYCAGAALVAPDTDVSLLLLVVADPTGGVLCTEFILRSMTCIAEKVAETVAEGTCCTPMQHRCDTHSLVGAVSCCKAALAATHWRYCMSVAA
jgi:hypothetical protein